MAGKGAAPGERRGGRHAGVPNKATTEAIEREHIEVQIAAPATVETVATAQQQLLPPEEGGRGHQRLAKDRLAELLDIFLGAAAYYQPTIDPTARANTNGNWDDFAKWSGMAMQCAGMLAKYQSPQFRAILLPAPAPTNQPEKRRRFTLTIFEGKPPAHMRDVTPPPANTPPTIDHDPQS